MQRKMMSSQARSEMYPAGGPTGQGHDVVITLAEYLEKLATQEHTKPVWMRRSVPTMTELADVACGYQNAVARFVRPGNRAQLFDLITPILHELRRRGFDARLSDIVAYWRE